MFMSGPLGIAARMGIGTYNLANKDGVRKTWNLASQGQYGRAALSGLGDLLNAGMAAEGISHIPNFLENAAIRYGQGAVQDWGRARTLSRAINQGVRETPIQSTFEPIQYDIRDNTTLYRANPVGRQRPTDPSKYGDTTGQYVGKWFTDNPQKPLHYAADYVRGKNPAKGANYYQFTTPRYWAEQQRASSKISNPSIEYEPEDFIIEDGIRGLQGTEITGRPGTLQYLTQRINPVESVGPSTYNHPGAFLGNTVTGGITVNGQRVLRKPYQTPDTRRVLLTTREPFMADKPKLSRGQFETLFNSGKIKKPEDLYKYMTTTQAGRIFKMASNVRKALGKFSSSNLHDKKDLQFYNAVLERSTQGLKGTKGTSTAIRQTLADEKARTSEGQYDLYLNNDDAQVLEEIRRQTQKDYGNQISFNEFQGGILASQNIPKAVAVTPIEIPGVGKFPLMERYLHNARERAEQLLPDLIRKGYMYVDPNTKMWVGRYNIKENPQPIDPSLFVLSFINNIRNSSNRVPVFREYSRAGTRELVLPIAWHGTSMGDKVLFTQYKNPTNIRPIFTTVSDGMPGSSNVKQAYQRGGTSIPFLFKRKTYNGKTYQEIPYSPINDGGSKSTGYILEDGTSIGQLMDHFSGGKGGGTARYVYDVSDQADIPHNSPQPQTEYIFGVGTPEVKSLLNTGDYLPYFNEQGNPIEGVTPFNKRGGKITINNQ